MNPSFWGLARIYLLRFHPILSPGHIVNKKHQGIILRLAAALLVSYSISCRFFDFLSKPIPEKTLILGGTTILTSFVIWLATTKWITEWPGNHFQFIWQVRLSAIFFVVIGFFIILPYHVPAFPMTHELLINPITERNSASSGNEIVLLEIKTISSPDNEEMIVPVSDDFLEGSWVSTDMKWKASGLEPASLHFSDFFKGRVMVNFKMSPESGIVDVVWEGWTHRIDLYSPVPDIRNVDLRLDIPWKNLNPGWKILVGGLIVADFSCVFGLILVLVFTIDLFGKETNGLQFKSKRLMQQKTGFVVIVIILAGIAVNLFRYSPLNDLKLILSSGPREIGFQNMPQIELAIKEIEFPTDFQLFADNHYLSENPLEVMGEKIVFSGWAIMDPARGEFR
ncbi:MAG: hypothetical protein AB9891_15740 [Anaerolineaceae bacterium]